MSGSISVKNVSSTRVEFTSVTNNTPVTGDLWHDGTSVNFQSSTGKYVIGGYGTLPITLNTKTTPSILVYRTSSDVNNLKLEGVYVDPSAKTLTVATHLVPDWTQSNYFTSITVSLKTYNINWLKLQAYLGYCVAQGSISKPVVVKYNNTTTVPVGTYSTAAALPNGFIYMAPTSQGASTVWHYIEPISQKILTFLGVTTGASTSNGIINGGQYRAFISPNYNFTYGIYINTQTGTTVTYTTSTTSTTTPYQGGCAHPNGRIYLGILSQTVANGATFLHSINYTLTPPTVNTFPLSSSAIGNGHFTVAPNGNVYHIPTSISAGTSFYYILPNVTPSSDSIVSYSNTTGITDGTGYSLGVLTRKEHIYLIPGTHAQATTWHYIDTTSNTIISYSNPYTSSIITNISPYTGGILTPDGRIYLLPDNQAVSSIWHYINTETSPPSVVSYINDVYGSTVITATNPFKGGCLDHYGRIWLTPHNQATFSTEWLYIHTGTNVNFNKNYVCHPFMNRS